MNEKFCRFCLQTATENYETIGESLKNILNLNMDICKEVVKCIECANKLKVFFNFQSFVNPKNRPLSTNQEDEFPADPENIKITNDLISFVELESETKCSFCSKTSRGKCLISLNESKEHVFLVDVLREHIPKLNLNTTEVILICEDCLDGLQSILSFVMKCMDVEHKINKYIEMNGTDANGQIELKNVRDFIFEPTIKFKDESESVNKLEERFQQFQEGCTMHSKAEIQFEKETDDPDYVSIETEEIEIKSEQSDCNRIQDPSFSSTMIESSNESLSISDLTSQNNEKICGNQPETCINEIFLNETMQKNNLAELELNKSTSTIFKCDQCPYETESESHFKTHMLTHKSTLQVVTFRCDLCPYKSKRKYNLEQHQLTHKSALEVTMFRCDLCGFESKYRRCLKKHELTHKSYLGRLFKCEMCPYETIRKDSLTSHELIHKSTSELTMFKCDQCPYETKRRSLLKLHTLTHHKSTAEVATFKCDLCSYEAKRKQNLKQHELTHKSTLEVRIFSCDICAFVTKHRQNVKKHKLTHKKNSDTMFKCELCPYETIRKDSLTKHQLIHKSASEIRTFKCDQCPYVSKNRSRLKQHTLIHKSTSESIMYKCEQCPYETKINDYLRRHRLVHKSSSGLTVRKCDQCPFEAEGMDNLKQHKMTHQRFSGSIFKCYRCPYVTKLKGCLIRHVRTHKSIAEKMHKD